LDEGEGRSPKKKKNWESGKGDTIRWGGETAERH